MALLNWTRVVGAAALVAILAYGWIALDVANDLSFMALAGIVLATVIGAIVAAWSLWKLDESQAAQWLTLILLGLAPLSAWIGWMFTGDPEGLLETALLINALLGAAVLVLAGWVLLGTYQEREAPAYSRPRSE